MIARRFLAAHGTGWPCLVHLLPNDERPDHIGCWMLRFTDAVPKTIGTYPEDIDFSDMEQPRAYAEAKLFPVAFTKSQGSRRTDPA
jgi:hypothetical protein